MTGKTIYPFCTSSYTPVEDSLALLKEAAPDATFGDGLTANSDADTAAWITQVTSAINAE